MAIAGGTCVHTNTKAQYDKLFVLVTCTADASDASMSAAVPSTAMRQLSGRYIYNIVTYPGGTAPTDNSDIAIADSDSYDVVTASGNGLNKIDATTTRAFYTEGPDGGDEYYLVHEDKTLTITQSNNSVNSAIVNYLFRSVK